MDCHVCEVRSSVGYCVECQQLLCETCGVPCEHCGKISCPDHIHETRTGRRLCKSCHDERRSKRDQLKAAAQKKAEEKTSLAALESAEEEGGVNDEALVISAREPLRPWQMSMYVAGGGLLIVLAMLIFPSLRHIPLSGANYIPTTYIILVFPLLAIIWGAIGLIKEDYYQDRPKCFIGIGVSVIATVLAFVAMWTDPAATAKSEADQMQSERQGMTPEELKEWRQKTLGTYRQP